MLLRRQLLGVVMFVLVLLLYGSTEAQQDDQARPEGGFGASAKITRFIQVRGIWRKNGYTITAVKPGGPATRMKNRPDGKPTATIERGDRIVEVESIKIESQVDYAKAMNQAKDPHNIELKVWDRNSGKVYTWYVGSKESPFSD